MQTATAADHPERADAGEPSAAAAWWQQPLPIGRYRLVAEMLDPLELPTFAGSLLRGQFGAALRNLTCRTHAPHCAGCAHTAECTYARVFDGQLPAGSPHRLKNFAQVPNPYVIAPPPGGLTLRRGEALEWGMVLVGHAVQHVAVILAAWHQALAQGLGPERSRARLRQVLWLDGQDEPRELATPQGGQDLSTHRPHLRVPDAAWTGGAVTLELITPLRLQQQQGLVGPERLTAPTLMGALARRVGLMLALHGGTDSALMRAAMAPALAAQVEMQSALEWQDQVRYSARQGNEMALGGLMGSIILMAAHPHVAKGLWPWLWLGQWLHGGKNATMGLGRYRLRVD